MIGGRRRVCLPSLLGRGNRCAMELDRPISLHVAVLASLLSLSACGNGAASPAASSASAAPSASASISAAAFVPSLKPGDPAPSFELMGSDGKKHALADHVGREAVVIAWFPKAFTSG